MASLGSFGAALRELDDNPEPDTFQFCGEEFVVVGRIPPMLTVQIGAAVTGKIAIGEAEMMGATWETLRLALTKPARGDTPADPTGFQRFYRAAVDNCVPADDIVSLTMTLTQAEMGRPTVRDSGSSVGVLSTSPSLSPSSIHPGLAHLRPVSEVLAG